MSTRGRPTKNTKIGRPVYWESQLNFLKNKLEKENKTPHWIYEVCRVSKNTMKIWKYKDPREITEDDIYLMLSSIGGGVRNQKYHIVILSVFLSHCGNHVIRGMKFRFPQDMRPNARWLTHEQVIQLLSTQMDPRERFIVRMGLSMGMRNCEMRRLTINDIKQYPDGYYFDVIGKYRKRRSIPASKKTMEAYWDYLEWRRDVLGKRKTEMLIVGARSLGLTYNGMRMINLIIRQKSCVKWSFHDLRRTWGRTAFEAKQPLLKIMFILGHSSETQTIDYLGLRMDDGKDAIDATEDFFDRKFRS